MGVKVPLDDRTQLDDVVEWVEKFNASTEQARDHVKEQESKYEVKLNESIVALEQQCSQLTRQLNESPFIDELDEDPSIEFTSSVIDAFDQVHETMENLQTQAAQLSKIKSLFDSMEYKCTPMETLKMMFDEKKRFGI